MSDIKTSFNVKDDGFTGYLFKSENEICPNKALIVCTGSDGDVEFIKELSEKFSSCGITTLGLCFFNTPDTSKAVDKVPIDYIEKAALYLKSIGYEKIGIWGISMGSVYVLLGACYYPDLIQYVIAASPLYFVFEAVDVKKCKIIKGESSFSYKGEPIPFEPYTNNMNMFIFMFDFLKNFEPNFSRIYGPLVDKAKESSIIPVEKMKAKVLLVSGKRDTLWPSYISAEKIIERLKSKNYTYPYEHLSFEYGGHYTLPFDASGEKSFQANRKFPEENKKYKEENLNKIIEGFKTF
ncbi:alpha/beta-hydrolase [Anaeromyces robustus]|uniref:Alpha/beta-hydrolase n=1 Tax=Anaeromyces robustus TaxID=1754192 RepID=A0A1Y1WEI7_9FUNG|nr:alpha/beta-hydrolase [Anaeromyces robustus]|eukprot:ORX71748.1 alpha/beta-hydrolase [Anaeromyces robustus]